MEMNDVGVIRELADLNKREKKLRCRIEEIPRLIDRTQKTIAEADEEVTTAKDKAGEQRRRLRSLELEIEEMNERLVKYSRQLLDIKTNKEYQSLKKEITDLETAVREREDQMLETMELLDDYTRLVTDTEANIVEIRVNKEQTLTELKKELKDTEVQLIEVAEKRKRATDKLSPQIREEYLKLMSHYDGEAIVPDADGVCNGCFVNIPPKIIGELKAERTIIRCEQCGRFLYAGDEFK